MKASLELLLRVAAVFNSLEYSPAWAEMKSMWPEVREGGVVASGDVRTYCYTASINETAVIYLQ
jgi:hypothetical protein